MGSTVFGGLHEVGGLDGQLEILGRLHKVGVEVGEVGRVGRAREKFLEKPLARVFLERLAGPLDEVLEALDLLGEVVLLEVDALVVQHAHGLEDGEDALGEFEGVLLDGRCSLDERHKLVGGRKESTDHGDLRANGRHRLEERQCARERERRGHLGQARRDHAAIVVHRADDRAGCVGGLLRLGRAFQLCLFISVVMFFSLWYLGFNDLRWI